jgi:bifunctional UDP-N-acetylglucosamine pyrophosphorylase/glucosamine-1-phosphate N-acetyltransferase
MRSPLPKVLHEAGGQPLLFHILNRVLESAPRASVAIVVGHAREKVEAAVRGNSRYSAMEITFIHQAEQRGTGHAARCAMDSPWGAAMAKAKASVLVLPGDLPLMTSALVAQMFEPLGRSAMMRLLTCELTDPTGYGRIVRRGKKGPPLRIVEEKDANLREKQISEVGASIYLFNSAFLKVALGKLSNKNAQGEYYLTDLVALTVRAQKKVDVLEWKDAEDLRGVNDPWELALANRISNERIVKSWAQKGVRFLDPMSAWIDETVQIGEETVVHPGVILSGSTVIGRNVTLGPRVVLKHTKVGDGAHLKVGTVAESSSIGAEAQIGPYAHLRPESDVGKKSKIGNFVELKKAKIGVGTSVAHLSYVGDATVGDRVNIGCGFVTCNYDGRTINGNRKHQTIIEDDVFVGSACQTVAPLKVGKGAYIASGSTITEDVEPESLAIARARQVNKPGYARKLKVP